LARENGLDFLAGHGNVPDYAFTTKLGIEAAGRELRYRWFAQLAEQQRLDSVATAHTLDDQAETVLLKFLRGAGTKGLAGIYPVLDLATPGGSSGAEAPLQEMAVDGAAEGAPLQSRVSPGVNLRIVRPCWAFRVRRSRATLSRSLRAGARMKAISTIASCAIACATNCCRCWSASTTRRSVAC
jgi:hypothetical protein